MIAIHIGSSKAGSTTIQKFLGANADALRRAGADYPNICQANRGSHVNLYYELKGHPNFKPEFGSMFQLIDRLRRHEYGTTILSAEELQRSKPREVAVLKEQLVAVDKDIQIKLIIRDLVDFMPSTYSQETKVGENALDFDTFFHGCVRRRGKAFMDAARVWGDAFGWDRLSVRVLDRNLLLNGDLVDDFLAGVGIDPTGNEFERPEALSVANASPGWRVLEAVRALYSGDHGLEPGHPLARSTTHAREERKLIGRIARLLGSELGWNEDRGRYLSRAQAERCVRIYGKVIHFLNERLHQPLPPPLDLMTRGFRERESMPEASQIPAPELRGFYDELAARARRKRRAASAL
jgi:hypothetical protein